MLKGGELGISVPVAVWTMGIINNRGRLLAWVFVFCVPANFGDRNLQDLIRHNKLGYVDHC